MLLFKLVDVFAQSVIFEEEYILQQYLHILKKKKQRRVCLGTVEQIRYIL